jgi:ATP-dependent RNA helicase RhlE
VAHARRSGANEGSGARGSSAHNGRSPDGRSPVSAGRPRVGSSVHADHNSHQVMAHGIAPSRSRAAPRALAVAMSSFSDLGLAEPLVRAVADLGYQSPTPIQLQAIPPVLAGKDLLGCARTGTGKTAAFALPILQRLSAEKPARHIRALVLAPTRELAAADSRHLPPGLRPAPPRPALGGDLRRRGQSAQVPALESGVDILVACPGRLLDLSGQGLLEARRGQILVLDEADRMLDMGFVPDVKRVIARLPATRRQRCSSRPPCRPTSTALSQQMLRDPIKVEASPSHHYGRQASSSG